eukprot:m.130086 g.130086  ORF g.130086 m.130086 type:complete len:1456 (+) comp16777_c2_seq1:356-4723(+)
MASPGTESRQQQIRKLAGSIEDTASQLAVDGLLDSLVAIFEECKAPGVKTLKPVQSFVKRYAEPTSMARDLRIGFEDFERIRLIGRGAFGEVWLVKYKNSGEVFALKKLSKCEMLKRSDSAFFWEERDIMSHAKSPWIVTLHYAFQDPQYLYMAMEYMAGGNLVTLQDNYDFPEAWVQFYTAELVMAVHALHQMGYIHRDVKPDNLLLDAHGHIKLADFGTCIKMDSRGLVKSEAAVGTPDYISPEVLESQDGRGEYGKECDWWSVGVFLYELLFGDTPFYSETMVGTYGAILNHNPDKMKFPEDFEVSEPAQDLVRKLLCKRDKRLGSGPRGVEDIKDHPFFAGVDWEGLRSHVAPFVPEIDSEVDASNFPDVEKSDVKPQLFAQEHRFSGNQLPFIGFTYTRDKLFSVLAEADAGGRQASSTSASPAAITADAAPVVDASGPPGSLIESQSTGELQAARDKAEAQVRALQQKLEDLEADAKTQRQDAASIAAKELKVVQLEATEAKRKLESLTEENASLEAKLQEASAAKDKAVGDLAKVQRDSARAHQAQAGVESEVENLTTELQAARAEAMKLRLLNQELEGSLSDAQADQMAAQTKLDDARRAARSVEGELDEMQDKISSQARTIRRNKERTAELEDECDDLRHKSSQARAQVLSAQHQIADLEEELAELSEAKAKTDALVLQLRQSAMSATDEDATPVESAEGSADLADKLAAETDRRAQAESELAGLQAQLDQMRADMKKAQRKRRESMDPDHLTSAIAESKRKVKQMEAKLNEAVGELETAQRAAEAAKKRADELLEENEAKSTELQSLRKAKESFNSAAKQTASLKSELESERKAAEERIAGLHQQVQKFTEQVSQLQQELDEVSDSRTAAEDRLTQREAAFTDVEHKLKEQAESAATLRSQFERLQIDTDHYKEQLGMATEAKESTHASLVELKAKFEAERADLMAKLETAQSGDSGPILKENEILRRELQRSQALVLEKQGAYAQQCLKTQEAVAKLQAQMLKTSSVAVGGEKKTTKKSELEATVRRLTKLNKGWELKYKKLEDLLQRQQQEQDQQLQLLQEEEEARVRKLQDNLKKESQALKQEIETLRKEYEEKATETETLQHALDTIQSDDVMSPAQRATLKKRVSSVSEILESWVMVPNRGNIRKFGWARRFLVLGPSGLFVFESDVSKATDDAEVCIGLDELFQVRPVQQHECIHAKPGEIPRIFQVMAIKAPRSLTGTNSSASLVSRDRMNTVATDTLQSPRRPTLRRRGPGLQNVHQAPTVRSASFGEHNAPVALSSKTDVIHIHGHEFEKAQIKKTAVCVLCQKTISSWGLGKQKCYECKHCHCVMHVKHMESSDCENIEGCQGGTDATMYFFLANTAEEQRRWVSRISFLIQRRGAKTLEAAERRQRGSSGIFSQGPDDATRKSSLSTSVVTAPAVATAPSVKELDDTVVNSSKA